MTRTVLLERLRDLTEEATAGVLLPVRRQKGDGESLLPRPAKIYLMGLPEAGAAVKKAPYILHQIVTGKDTQKPGDFQPEAQAVVRSVFCVYHEDGQEGSLALLGLMERVRIALLEQVVIGKQFKLDLSAGLETLVYPDDTAPYYIGEVVATWKLPGITRKVD